MKIKFEELKTPTLQIARAMERWGNDPAIKHLMRPSMDKISLDSKVLVTVPELTERLEDGHVIYLIYADEQLVGEMNYVVNPPQLMDATPGSAWLGISIGAASARGQGIGTLAMTYLEERIREANLARMELGVFEYNERAILLYKKMGFQELGRVEGFTYWQGKMWTDIRMEKWLK
jgi:RimJ/RimL family protein N-acetyltransferase